MSFEQTSYRLHENHYDLKGNDLSRLKNTRSIDFWRHDRMYRTILPLISQEETWLTIGDGLGTDANWLSNQNLNVTASDIADTALFKAKSEGFINKYCYHSYKYDLSIIIRNKKIFKQVKRKISVKDFCSKFCQFLYSLKVVVILKGTPNHQKLKHRNTTEYKAIELSKKNLY